MQIGVYEGACPSQDQLGGGIPASGAVAEVAFQKGDDSPPVIGALKKAEYAFAAAARAADCSVVATGCTQADVTEARDVSISLGATSASAGACTSGETCADGRCVPTSDPNDPTLGAGCSMQLVGAGPLGLPLELSGSDTASTPAVVVTEAGFLVAYREYDPNAGAAQLTVAVVDEGGSITIPAPTQLPGQCTGSDESDAVGAAYAGGSGVVVSARPACAGGSGAGFDVFAVDASATVLTSGFDSLAGAALLSNDHAVALSGATTGYVAYLDQGSANLVGLGGLQTTGAAARFGGAPPQTLAQVAATDQTVALLAGTGTKLELQLGTASVDGGAPFTMPGTFGAVAAQGSRAFLLAGNTGATSLSFETVDVGATSAAPSTSFTPPGQGGIAGADVAAAGDRLFFAVEQPGALSVVVYDHASTSPVPLATVLLADDARIPSQETVRDGRIALAASDSRVLVAWLTATDLGPDDPIGGYALFACSP
ncbi:MAG TPA: hypothetical protein VGG39_30680 [Polyangiaceae bacterium]|jgi:hypothetical protein